MIQVYLDGSILILYVVWKVLDIIFSNLKSNDSMILFLLVLSIVGYILLNV